MGEPVKVEVAFQGGGAKFTELLLVAWALRELELERRIKVERCVGTSAGSIAAAMLAARVDFAGVCRGLGNSEGAQLLRSVEFPGRYAAAWRVVRGNPILSFAGIRKWLAEYLAGGDERVTVSDIVGRHGTELVITRCLLTTRTAIVAGPNSSIVDAIQQSCAIPFLFAGWSDLSRPESCVDGGLANNLPISHLNLSGNVLSLAVSFSRSSGETVGGFRDYVNAIVDIVMLAQEDHARAKLPAQNILDLKTGIGTLGFADAFKAMRDVNLVRNGVAFAKSRILDRVNSWQTQYSRQYPLNYWRDESDSTRALMEIAGELYCRQEKEVPLRVRTCRILVKSNLTRARHDALAGEADRLELSMTISAVDRPVRSMCFILFSTDADAQFCLQFPEIEVHDARGNRVDLRLVPARFMGEGGAQRQVVVHFLVPLECGDDFYTITYKESVHGLTSSLIKERRDELCYSPERADGTIDKVELIAYVANHSGCSYRMVPKEFNGTGDQMGRQMQRNELPGNQDNLQAIGWIGENLNAEAIRKGWGVDLVAN